MKWVNPLKPASLHGRLRWLVIVVLAAVLLPLGVLSFKRTAREVGELSDGRLAQSARTLQVLIAQADLEALQRRDPDRVLVPIEAGLIGSPPRQRYTYESEVGFQVFEPGGRLALATANLAGMPPPQAGDADFQDVWLGTYRWRVFTLRDAASRVVIRTGERYDSRDEIMHAVWLEHSLPLLVGLPLLALLVGWAIRRGLRPLEALTRALSSREPGSHEPVLLRDAPLELQPVLAALNEQLTRLEDALERERRFSADVAHELRTPLASAMINLENAMASADPAEVDLALGSAQHVIGELARRVEQLLALARLEAGAASGQRMRVDLTAVATGVLEELAPVIAESGVELSVARLEPQLLVHGYEAALAALLRNLLENALRHVPAGGQVQLSIERGEHAALIDVIDDGPGIPAERRASVFARFRRESGSRGDGYGLGLSIVQRAAQLHGAAIELLDSPYGSGLRVHVAIPLPH
ncbi:two-component sensor histidine kinase [Rhodanobacter thiooxydans]|uniref:histidine kinase n=1 Tax=Rhodanobacter thiooxydans TaxID=416169 RepID=A0A154QGK7_9GAMM|nr:ATP-binding protein [Rhodanobacter thiooxydans]EIM03345.1 signal transduction histidine kinase [Rhodanobacter thiooxydans LCS2]KZC23371.1 two-component sensor histidine kinase [Rhodanobacter thiooxydans]MCW0201441.1 ATP-binding protein [Rhodanobacter thiooxydans]